MTKTAAPKPEDAVAAARSIAEKGVAQANETYERLKARASEAAKAVESAYSKSADGYKDLGRKSIELSNANVRAQFDHLSALIKTKSVDEAVELNGAFARRQIALYAEQLKELSTLAQKAVAVR